MSTLRTTRHRAIPAMLAGGVAAALVLSGCSGREQAAAPEPGDTDGETVACDPGFTDTEVKIGNSMALSGAAAAYAAISTTMKAYFDDLNAAGGVEFFDGTKRTVTIEIMDDAYDPAKTATNVRTLVEQKGVFALAGTLGTGAAIAVADYVEENGIPNLFTGTGADAVEDLHEGRAWTTAYLPQYGFEVKALSKYIAENFPGAKAALIYQNDDFGESIKAAFETELAGTGVEIIAAESFEQTAATVDSQISTLAASGADLFLNWTTGAFSTQSFKKKAELGWDATTILSTTVADANVFLKPAGPGAADGTISIAYAKDVTDLTQKGADAGFDAWTAFAEKHPDDVNAVFAPSGVGYSTAQLLEAALENMDGCTREDLLDAVHSLTDVELDLSPLKISTDEDYPYVYRTLAIQEFNGDTWDLTGAEYSVDD